MMVESVRRRIDCKNTPPRRMLRCYVEPFEHTTVPMAILALHNLVMKN